VFKKISVIGLGLLCLNGSVLAQDNNSFYTQIGAGISFPVDLKISGIDPALWDQAYEGYGARLSNTPVFSIGFGYNFSKCLSALVSSDWRGIYHYAKYQTFTGAAVVNPVGHKNRLFDLKNTNLMLSFIINGSCFDKLHVDFSNDSMLTPFVGIGLGVAQNTLSNFHSIRPQDPDIIRSYMKSKTSYSVAAQGMAGVYWAINKKFGLDMGYRFYYGGKFVTNTQTLDPITPSPTMNPPWEAKLLTNEVFVNLKYNF